jgi:hypothetical protein
LAPSYGSAWILFGKKRKKKEVIVFVCFFGRLILVAFKDYTVGKKKTAHTTFLLRPRRRPPLVIFYALAVAMGSCLTSSGSALVLRCPVLFNGTNYRNWVPHMRNLLWDFLTGELPCPSSPSAPT